MTDTLATALVNAQKEMPAVEKTASANYGKYATLDHIIAKTRSVLNDHGLSIVQLPEVTENGSPGLRTTITHVSGESVSALMPLLLVKQDMQSLGSALTYARRYAWAAALGISTEADDDAALATSGEDPKADAGVPTPPALASADTDVSQADPAQVEPASSPEAFPIPEGIREQLPADSGAPQDAVVHFGKNAGVKLGDMTRNQVKWYADNELRSNASEADLRLKAAAQKLLELEAA